MEFLHSIFRKANGYFKNILAVDSPSSKEPPIGRTIYVGGIVVAIFFGIFGLWAALIPLESAAVAPGKIIVSSHSKTIQHLEGGIIKKIFISEGDSVKIGSPLIQLNDTQAKASFDALNKEVNELLATEARLIAEKNKAPEIVFPERLLTDKNNHIETLLKLQQDLFKENVQNIKSQLEIFNERIKQLNEEIAHLKSQIDSEIKQLGFVKDEIKAVKYLEEKQLIERNKLWILQREAARLEGSSNEHLAEISRAEQKIGEAKQQILTIENDYHKKLLTDLQDTRNKLSNSLEQEKNAEYILKRTLIVAPQEGIVANLKEYTITGVIKPGEALLDIVPVEDTLIAEVRINPLDIDVVHPGLSAKIRLIAYKQRTTPIVEGEVTYVSADSIHDEATNETYYTARIVIPPKQLEHLHNVKLYPGMPLQALIIIGRRTALEYLLSPIKDSLSKAFTEQ